MLTAFAELVRSAGLGPVADLGCGPGQVTAHLAGLGLSTFGIDLSPKMIMMARQAYPELRYAVGSMTALGLGDGALGGILAWYSRVTPRRISCPCCSPSSTARWRPAVTCARTYAGDDGQLAWHWRSAIIGCSTGATWCRPCVRPLLALSCCR